MEKDWRIGFLHSHLVQGALGKSVAAESTDCFQVKSVCSSLKAFTGGRLPYRCAFDFVAIIADSDAVSVSKCFSYLPEQLVRC